MNLLRNILNKVASCFFPNPCIVCGKVAGKNKFLCKRCARVPIYIGRNSVCRTCCNPLNSGLSYCSNCLTNKPKYERLVTCLEFSGKARRMMYLFKFYNRPDFCDSYALLIYKELKSLNLTDFDVIIPVPLSKDRLKERGYNQSELICKRLSELLKIPYCPNALIKVKSTKRQSRLSMHDREANIRGAFVLSDKERILQKRVLLVDDIVTTGATMREASRVLFRSAESITACAVFKTVLK